MKSINIGPEFVIGPKDVPVKISLPQLKTDYEEFLPARLTYFVAVWFQSYETISEVGWFWRKKNTWHKKDPSILITKAYKGNITTVLDKGWYDHKINKMLDHLKTKTNPTASTTQDVNKFVNNLLESKKIIKASWRPKCQMLQHPGCTDYRNYRKKTTFQNYSKLMK